ncbi:MAG TPA: ubiquinone biosynthesis regulatory protein kinase UbiB [Xanthomonadales bacterium]|nr:ubiquinone biosynthesis regulatory protein kinase UbiB [Xanthomonadales bacterium]
MRGFIRLAGIARVLLRYRLDELVEATHLFRPLRLVRGIVAPSGPEILRMPRGARLRKALEELGPIFVKVGQILSTRRDLLPADVADELTLLQDRVKPFDGALAERLVEEALGKPIGELFRRFDRTPLASASIAQVHAAELPDGREVVVKVLRPCIDEQIARDLSLLRTLGGLAQRYAPNARYTRPLDVVAEVERTLVGELDLQREGANASVLKRNFEGSKDLYVPGVHWSHSNERVLTLERVRGIPSDDVAALDAAGIDRNALAAKGVRVFYTQVFRDNFFHADAHVGNIWVDPSMPDDPCFIALDFGIMGALPAADQYYIAQNFSAMFTRDYHRIAALHIDAGWMPSHIRVDDLEAAIRSVCEPYFTRPLAEISLGEVLGKIFRMAQRYELTIQPQLLLLQKTLLNIEGVGRLLDPKLDIWSVARPVLDEILREKYSVAAMVDDFRRRLPELLSQAPELPRLVHDYLAQATRGEQSLVMRSNDLHALAETTRRAQRAGVLAVLGAGLLIAGAVLVGLDVPGPRWFGMPAIAVSAAIAALLSFAAALRRGA